MAATESELSRAEFKKALTAALALKVAVIFSVDGVPLHIHLGADPDEMYGSFIDNKEVRALYRGYAKQRRVTVTCSVHMLRAMADPDLPPMLNSFAEGIVAWEIGESVAPEVGTSQSDIMEKLNPPKPAPKKNGNGNGAKSTAAAPKKSGAKKQTTVKKDAPAPRKQTTTKKTTVATKKTTARRKTAVRKPAAKSRRR